MCCFTTLSDRVIKHQGSRAGPCAKGSKKQNAHIGGWVLFCGIPGSEENRPPVGRPMRHRGKAGWQDGRIQDAGHARVQGAGCFVFRGWTTGKTSSWSHAPFIALLFLFFTHYALQGLPHQPSASRQQGHYCPLPTGAPFTF
jgi:hypothetical protein